MDDWLKAQRCRKAASLQAMAANHVQTVQYSINAPKDYVVNPQCLVVNGSSNSDSPSSSRTAPPHIIVQSATNGGSIVDNKTSSMNSTDSLSDVTALRDISTQSRCPSPKRVSSHLSPCSQTAPKPKQAKHEGGAYRTLWVDEAILLQRQQQARLQSLRSLEHTAYPEASSEPTQGPYNTAVPRLMKVTEPLGTPLPSPQDNKPTQQDTKDSIEEIKQVLGTMQDDLKKLNRNLPAATNITATYADTLSTRFSLLERDLSLQEERLMTFIGTRADNLLRDLAGEQDRASEKRKEEQERQKLKEEQERLKLKEEQAREKRQLEARLRADAERQVTALAGPDGGVLSKLATPQLRAVIRNATKELVVRAQAERQAERQARWEGRWKVAERGNDEVQREGVDVNTDTNKDDEEEFFFVSATDVKKAP